MLKFRVKELKGEEIQKFTRRTYSIKASVLGNKFLFFLADRTRLHAVKTEILKADEGSLI